MSSEVGGAIINAGDISGTSVTVIGGVTISGNQVFISGQPVTVSGNAIRISGQTVIAEISGQTIIVPSTSVSGNALRISGQTIIGEISGQTIIVPFTSVSGNAVKTSGQVAYIVSGQNGVQIYGYDPSGDALRPLIVNQSGGNVLRVDAGSISVASNVSGNAVRISGETVRLVSGHNGTQLYGYDPSGDALRPLIVNQSGGNVLRVDAGAINVASNVSGNAVRISGETVVLTSGSITRVQIVDDDGDDIIAQGSDYADDNQGVGTLALLTTARLAAYDEVQSISPRVRVTASGKGISGVAHKLVVTFSGDSIIGSVSGNAVGISGQVVLISGQTVVASVTTNISGQTVYLTSGQNAVQNSGQVSYPVSGNAYLHGFGCR